NCAFTCFTGSSSTGTGADHVVPPSRDDITKTSASQLGASIQLTYSIPLFGPVLKSTPVTAMPFARSRPSIAKSQPPGIGSIVFSFEKFKPPSSDFLKTSPDGPAQTM